MLDTKDWTSVLGTCLILVSGNHFFGPPEKLNPMKTLFEMATFFFEDLISKLPSWLASVHFVASLIRPSMFIEVVD